MRSPYISNAPFAKNVISYNNRVHNRPRQAKANTVVVFNQSMSFNRASFNDYIVASTGRSYATGINLVTIDNNDELIFELMSNVDIYVDLEGTVDESTRFTQVISGKLHITGENASFTISNGYNKSGSGAGLQIEDGIFEVTGTTFVIENCWADYGGGIYLLHGELRNKGTIYVNNCHSITHPGGGISIWTGYLSLQSDQSSVIIQDCSSGQEGGGIINFRGEINLLGKESHIDVNRCSAGTRDEDQSIGSAFFIGDIYLLSNVRGIPVMSFNGSGSYISANGCRNEAMSGIIVFFFANLQWVDESNSIVAKNNIIGTTPAIYAPCKCVVYFNTTTSYSFTPITIIPQNNVCDNDACNNVTSVSPYDVRYVIEE